MSINFWIFVGISLLMGVFALVVIIKKYRGRIRRPNSPDAVQSKPIKRGEKGEITYNGTIYSYQYHRGSKNTPPFLSISTACPSKGKFKITRETGFDRFFIRMGITRKLFSYDRDFDVMFNITSDYPRFAEEYFKKKEIQRITRETFEQGFTQLKLDGKQLTFYWTPYRRSFLDTLDVEKIAAGMDKLRENAASAAFAAETEDMSWKPKRLLAFIIPIFLLISGLIAVLWGMTERTPLDGGALFVDSLKISVPALVIFLYFALQLIRGHSTSHGEYIIIIALSLIGFPLAGCGYETSLNALLDQSRVTPHRALIVDKYITKSKNSRSYYLVVDSWRKNQHTETLGTNKSTYLEAVPNKDYTLVNTKEGKFKFEWLVDYYLVKPGIDEVEKPGR